ncbi:alginate export family protein [Dyadobacter sandarakinus]|uniref:Alginate export family protein n=1 Tax=Dyadobacter sandarakinus TaxID=2747268 RepID=A0ABX7I4E7_9BACT|nr:alginate export family protein [Dyadobacter sandarakinus]QRR00583.1 alginate export family protein [Dyadobacter sandarakinus]
MKRYFYLLWAGLVAVASGVPASAQFSLSAQLRTRTELLYGQGSPLSRNEKVAFFTSQRTRLHAGYKAERLQLFATLQDVRVWGQDASTNNRITSPALNGLMLHEAWAEIGLLDTAKIRTGQMLTLKIGRQELLYDDSRVLGNLDWLQQARRHDAAVLKYTGRDFTMHLGAAYNQNRELRSGTLYDGVPAGYPAGSNGIGTMYKSLQFLYLARRIRHGTLSFLTVKDDFQRYGRDSTGNKFLHAGTWKRITLGPYLQTSFGQHWNLTANAFYQTGCDKDGRRLDAWLYSVRGSYNPSRTWTIGPGFDFTSGTQPGAPQNHSFDPLYGTPHKFWGQMDYFYAGSGFGRGGLADWYVSSTIKVDSKLSMQADIHHFASASEVRNAQDQKLRAVLGNELDVILNYTMTKTITFQGGYCTFLPTATLAQVKGVSDYRKVAAWTYLMISIKPDLLK